MELPAALEAKPDILNGKPCLRGTRIPVYLVLRKFAAGETQEELVRAFPQITQDHVLACFAYAADIIEENA